MSHFAEIVDGKVARVIVAEQDFIDTLPGKWVQTSYNTHAGIHYGPDGQPDGGVALRRNFAVTGMTYDEERDEFYFPKPYPSWVESPRGYWVAPVDQPLPAEDGTRKFYAWDEATVSWVESTPPKVSSTPPPSIPTTTL